MESAALPDGLVVVVKRDCPTCTLVTPVLAQLAAGPGLTVFTQDDPTFPEGMGPHDDTDLVVSWNHQIETVPTLLRVEEGRETARLEGWDRSAWETFTGEAVLGEDLPAFRPGCGSMSVDPAVVPRLRARFAADTLAARRLSVGPLEDEIEALYDRGFSDGLPLVPPTLERVFAMLDGTTRAPDEIIAEVPPDLVPCTVEKVAINAVMAGCKPEYLPVVLAAVEAACTDAFNAHGLLCTTMPTAPVLIVNGPIRHHIGMNSGMNVLGQGNRANSTIGRALQLVIRNVGGGRPGEVDRATFGQPGKVGLCFAEDEEGSPWSPLSTDFGVQAGTDAVTLFPGEAPRSIVDQLSRDPESLARTFAANLITLHHPKLVLAFDAILAVGPEHARVFREAGWSKRQLADRLHELLIRPGDELVRGAGGIAEGMPAFFAGQSVPKFRPDGLRIVHCGGEAGLFSMLIGGWVTAPIGSAPICKEIHP
ncbi:MAG: thioredoxin [Myxococcota bacterium]